MGPWDDGWRAFVRRRGRGWGPSLCLWLRVWIRKWLWLNFCVMWHGGYPFTFLFYLRIIFIFYLHIFDYILSAEPVHTDSTRSSFKPPKKTCFFVRHLNFRDVYSKKKNQKKIHTTRLPHVRRTCGCVVNLPHNRTCGAASLIQSSFFLWNLVPVHHFTTTTVKQEIFKIFGIGKEEGKEILQRLDKSSQINPKP